MIKIQPPSIIGNYDLVSVLDDALVQPDGVERRPDEDEDAHRARVEPLWEQWRRNIDVARETGRWDSLIRPGATPARFHLRQVPGSMWSKIERVAEAMKPVELAALLVRMALVGATDWIPGFKVGPLVDHVDEMGRPSGLGRIASESVIDAFYAHHSGAVAQSLLNEIAEQVMRHRTRHSGN